MMFRAVCIVGLTLLTSSGLRAQPGGEHFAPLTSFAISGIAEIVDVSVDGNTLVYTNGSANAVGMVDIRNAASPVLLGELAVPGEPTSVSVVGNYALVTVWADQPSEGSPPPAFNPGQLVVVDISDPGAATILGSVPVGWHPDSVKAAQVGGSIVAVLAIENEPVVVVNGLVEDNDLPGNPHDVSPAGLIQVVVLDTTNPAASVVNDLALNTTELASAGLLFPDDPQPEFVTISGTTAAVSLQENNGVVVVDFSTPTMPSVIRIFSVGVASDRSADLIEEDAISLSNTYPSDIGTIHPLPMDGGGNPSPAGVRCPDGIAFTPDGLSLISADEGELNLTGGRGFSAWTVNGTLSFEETTLEQAAVIRGHYPESRSENRGIEIEGVTAARFGSRDYAFVLSERGSFMAIYRIAGSSLVRTQILPTGISPEGVVAIPSRGLVVTADEGSGTLSFFELRSGPYLPSPERPVLVGQSVNEPWSAISGLAAGAQDVLYAVPDNALPTSIYRILTGGGFAPIGIHRPVIRNGVQAAYDGEGIVVDDSILAPVNPGWWIASEGNGSSRPNLLVQVDQAGHVIREIQLPSSIDLAADPILPGTAPGLPGSNIRSNGFEGVGLSQDGRYLLVCIQREFTNEFASGQVYTRIARYDLQQVAPGALGAGLRVGGDWSFFFYPLESDAFGLSEITNIGPNQWAVVERDKEIGAEIRVRKIFALDLSGLTPDTDGIPDSSDTITKTEALDVRADFSPFEKVEGLALTIDGNLWVGLDNDGGELESRLVNTGLFTNPLEASLYPGSGEDLLLTVSINGASSPRGVSAVSAMDTITVALTSPGLSQVGNVPLILAQGFSTGSVPSTPGLSFVYLEFFGPSDPFVLFDGLEGPLGSTTLSPGGLSVGSFVIPGLPAGTSVMIQGGVYNTSSMNQSVAISNGVELRGL